MLLSRPMQFGYSSGLSIEEMTHTYQYFCIGSRMDIYLYSIKMLCNAYGIYEIDCRQEVYEPYVRSKSFTKP